MAIQRCLRFHGDPTACDEVENLNVWVPGGLVRVGACIDSGYCVTDRASKKDGRYVHDHKAGVKLYRRAKPNEKPDVTYRNFPRQLFVLGDWLGCTVIDEETGRTREIAGSSRIRAASPDGKKLVAVHVTKGVLYVIQGGKFRITDWMYD